MKLTYLTSKLGQLVLACCALSVSGYAQSFGYTAQSAVYNKTTDSIDFSITFSDHPDFTTTRPNGTLKYGFQYYIYGYDTPYYPHNLDSIIGQNVINWSQGKLDIQNPTGTPPPGTVGGWGDLRGQAVFSWSGNTLSFTVPVSVVSDHGPSFDYDLDLAVDGALISTHKYHVTNVPEPASVAMMLAGLGLVGAVARRRQKVQAAV